MYASGCSDNLVFVCEEAAVPVLECITFNYLISDVRLGASWYSWMPNVTIHLNSQRKSATCFQLIFTSITALNTVCISMNRAEWLMITNSKISVYISNCTVSISVRILQDIVWYYCLAYRYHCGAVGNSYRLWSEWMTAESTAIKGANIAILDPRMWDRCQRR